MSRCGSSASPRCCPRNARGGLCALGLLVGVGGTAVAGPWTHDKGGGYLQAAVLGERIDGEDAARLELYGEYGLTSKWTISTQFDALTFPELAGFDQFAYRATARRQFWQSGIWRAAFEGGVVGGEAIGGTVGGCSSVGGEARVSLGAGGQNKRERDWFAFADVIIREHGNCRRQRFEFGYGQEIFPNWYSVNKVFLEEGGGESSGDPRSAKLESVISRRFGRIDLGLGLRQEFGGRFNETGIIISLERRF